jgi:hypothetical protein
VKKIKVRERPVLSKGRDVTFPECPTTLGMVSPQLQTSLLFNPAGIVRDERYYEFRESVSTLLYKFFSITIATD